LYRKIGSKTGSKLAHQAVRLTRPADSTGLWRKRVGVEITVNLQIDRVHAALRTPTSLQSLLNITVLSAVGIEDSTTLPKTGKQRRCNPSYRDNHYKYYKKAHVRDVSAFSRAGGAEVAEFVSATWNPVRGILDFGQVFYNMPSGLRSTCFLALRHIRKQL
jgi:hypothetical protein